ncbi:MAG TPA: M20/M25/M40 family metallo-hydrolase [Rhizobium sp.]
MDSSGITFDQVSRADVKKLLSAMVAIPSINPSYAKPDQPAEWFGEARLAVFVADWLKAEGIEVRFDEVMPGRPNVIAHISGDAGAPTMIWEGHLDTVQVDGMPAPFEPRIEGARLYGRGAVDDKGCLTMFMLAMRELRRRGCRYDLTFVAAMDEEVTFEGVLHHVRTNTPYDLGIAGEPTSLAVVSACKGVIRWVIDINGRGSHAAKPEEGIDALLVAGDLVRHLRDYMQSTERAHPLLGRRTLTCTMMQAGEGANTVPAHAKLTFDFRTLPDQTGDDAWQEIAAVVAGFAKTHLAGAEIIMQKPFIDSVSMEVPQDARIVTELARVVGEAGYSETVIGVPFGSDASKMTRGGSPTVIFGPGRIEEAHTSGEFVDMDEVARGVDILVALAARA